MLDRETEQSFSKSKSRVLRLIVSRYRADFEELPLLEVEVEGGAGAEDEEEED